MSYLIIENEPKLRWESNLGRVFLSLNSGRRGKNKQYSKIKAASHETGSLIRGGKSAQIAFLFRENIRIQN